MRLKKVNILVEVNILVRVAKVAKNIFDKDKDLSTLANIQTKIVIYLLKI